MINFGRTKMIIVQAPLGKQDQYIAAFGNMRFIPFKDSSVKVEKIELSSEAKKILNDVQ